MGQYHASLWTFIKGLKDEEGLSAAMYTHAIQGRRPAKRRKTSKEKDRRVHNIVANGRANVARVNMDPGRLKEYLDDNQQMASSTNNLPIWHKDNREQYSLVDGSELGNALKNNRVMFTTIVQVDQIWAYLLQMEAVDSNKVASLKHNAPNHEIASRLADFMMMGPRWKFHAVMRALSNTNQEHVINAMGFNIDDYR